jgi:hypothetical protein
LFFIFTSVIWYFLVKAASVSAVIYHWIDFEFPVGTESRDMTIKFGFALGNVGVASSDETFSYVWSSSVFFIFSRVWSIFAKKF